MDKIFLNEDEIQLLRKIKSDNRILPCSTIMDVDVGIVTGKNNFFMLNKETVSEKKAHALHNSCGRQIKLF